ncbi:MAG: histidine phosphatase family protein [Alphaproteobacteria bacterium]|nr:histidine phosphatase family protein [Alphaproteobacteria bacterium]MBN2779978.1 histidine phosphatase family protein [Alphaproteobacteria bacterium]
MNRTKETAQIVGDGINLPVVLTAHVREINVGKAKGLTWEEVEENFPEIAKGWHQHFKEENKMLKFPKGESYHEFKGRIFSFMRFLLKKRPETNIAIATHGGVMDAVLNVMNKVSNRRFKNGEILCLEYKDEKLHFIKRVEI